MRGNGSDWMAKLARTGKLSPALEEHMIACRVQGAFPPNLSALAGVGFDKISSSRSQVLIRKTQSKDFMGREHLFTEMEICKGHIAVRYSCPAESDGSIRHLQAALFLLRVLSLAPRIQPDAESLATFLLPVIESSSKIAQADYERLSKKCADLQEQVSELSRANQRLTRESEGAANLSLELERQNSALRERASALEAIPDEALRELVLDWVSSHRGSFNSALFSKEHNILPSRAEEGLEMLLKSGALRKVGERFHPQKAAEARQYAIPRQGVVASFKAAVFGKR